MPKTKTKKSPTPPVCPEVRVKVEHVNIGELTPNTWNPNKQSDFIFEKELSSIRRFGFVDPVTVRTVGPKNKPGYGEYNTPGLEIIDGEHRWKAAWKLGIETIPVNNLGVISDSAAKSMTIVLNETRGQADPLKLSNLLQEITSEDMPEHERDLVADVLPFTEHELDGLLDLTKFSWDDDDAGGGASKEKKDPTKTVRIAIGSAIWRVPKEVGFALTEAVKSYVAGYDYNVTQAFESLTDLIESGDTK